MSDEDRTPPQNHHPFPNPPGPGNPSKAGQPCPRRPPSRPRGPASSRPARILALRGPPPPALRRRRRRDAPPRRGTAPPLAHVLPHLRRHGRSIRRRHGRHQPPPGLQPPHQPGTRPDRHHRHQGSRPLPADPAHRLPPHLRLQRLRRLVAPPSTACSPSSSAASPSASRSSPAWPPSPSSSPSPRAATTSSSSSTCSS